MSIPAFINSEPIVYTTGPRLSATETCNCCSTCCDCFTVDMGNENRLGSPADYVIAVSGTYPDCDTGEPVSFSAVLSWSAGDGKYVSGDISAFPFCWGSNAFGNPCYQTHIDVFIERDCGVFQFNASCFTGTGFSEDICNGELLVVTCPEGSLPGIGYTAQLIEI